MLHMSVMSDKPFAKIHMQTLKEDHIPVQWHVNATFHFAIAGKLTSVVGKALAGFPVEPWMGKVLLAGAELGCAREALIVVAMAATDPVWLTPRLLPLLCLLPCPVFALSLPFPLPFLCPFPCPFFALPLPFLCRSPCPSICQCPIPCPAPCSCCSSLCFMGDMHDL